MNESIKLPAIKGVIGDWVYYLTCLPFKEVIARIDNDHSIREYKSLDDHLQRELSKRSKKIATYLLREKTRFFNTAIIGLFGSNPKWYTFGFAQSIFADYSITEQIAQTVGILELAGSEVLFSIDGQHRVEGIRQALKKNTGQFELDELPIIIIAHTDNKAGKQRTRRLFSEVNTKAVKVTGLDDLITNEDNPIFINARKLYADYPLFNKNEFILLSHKSNIDANAVQFTTILNLKEINNELYQFIYKHEDFRPSDAIINKLYKISEQFWTNLITRVKVIKSVLETKRKTVNDYRYKNEAEAGGSLLFRPIGLKILAQAYAIAERDNHDTDVFWNKIDHGEFALNGKYWSSIAWDDTKKVMIPRRDKLMKEYLFYLLGLPYEIGYLIDEYNAAFGISKDNPKKKKLPLPFDEK